jgi:uncharacterized membrane protein
MTDSLAVKGLAAVGCAVNGGVLFAFSSFVMPGFNRLDPAAAIAAMNAVNVTAVRPAFMTVLFGTAALTVATGVLGLRRRQKLLVIGSAVYLVGVIGLTMAYHVPLNDALARFDPATGDAARTWADYARGWTALNHVRALAGVTAAVLIGLSAYRNRQSLRRPGSTRANAPTLGA